jgi:hypothetical protein
LRPSASAIALATLPLALLAIVHQARAQEPLPAIPGPAASESPATAAPGAAPSPDAARSAETRQPPEAEPQAEPWYHGWRLELGGYLATTRVTVTERRGNGQQADFGGGYSFSPAFLASTPEWTFHTSSGGSTLGVALFFGGATFSTNTQNVDQPTSSSSCSSSDPNCSSTNTSSSYQDVGTSLHGTYTYYVPTLVWTVPGDTRTLRMGLGAGVGSGQVDGKALFTPDGSIHENASGTFTGNPKLETVHESVAADIAVVVLMEVEWKHWVFSLGGAGPTLRGYNHEIQIVDIRLGVAYDFTL